MAKEAVDCEDMPTHPNAPKRASARSGHVNSFVSGGGKKGKGKKSRKKHVAK